MEKNTPPHPDKAEQNKIEKAKAQADLIMKWSKAAAVYVAHSMATQAYGAGAINPDMLKPSTLDMMKAMAMIIVLQELGLVLPPEPIFPWNKEKPDGKEHPTV